MAPTTAAAHPPSPESNLNPKTIRKAIKALIKWHDSQPTPNPDQFIYLVLTLTPKTINPNPKPTSHLRRHVTTPIPLPHPILPPSSTFTLIYDDRRRNSTLTHDVIQSRIATHNLPITETLKLSKLKSHLATFEARRALMDTCDCFLVDDRITGTLPEVFYRKRRRVPVAVDLSKKDRREEVERVRRSTIVAGLNGSGSCNVVRVARVEMESEEIAENVVRAVEGIVGIVPKKWKGVRAVHLKLLESLALPVYEADGNAAV